MASAESPLVAVIILCWNNRDLLKECINSVLEQTYDNCRVILVDNGSTDGSAKYVSESFPEVTLIETGSNLGFAIGNNVGIRRALENSDCKYVVLLNTDATIDQDWIEKMVAFAGRHPKLASAQCLTVDYYDHEVIDSCGILVDRQGVATQIGYRQKNVKLTTQKVFGVNAAAALFSRAFLEAQPFGDDYLDADLWMYLEDVDIGARALVMGWENWFVNEARAYHMGSASSGKNPGFSFYMTYRNNALVLVKNLPLRIILKLLPALVRDEWNRISGLWRERRFSLIRAMIKGRFVSLRLVPLFIGKRRKLKKRRGIGEAELWAYMEVPKLEKLEMSFGSESVAIVVLSRDNMGSLEGCLTTLVGEEYANKQVIVVDNNSTDGSQEYIRRKYPEVTLLQQESNLGTANGFNVGLVHALHQSFDYVALVQASTEVEPGWIDTMVHTMRDYPDAFAVGSKVYDQSDTGRSAGRVVNQGYVYHPTTGVAPFAYEGRQIREVFAVSDSASMYRVDKLGLVGIMDGDFFCGLEDVDLCFRARLAGLRTYSQPRAVARTSASSDLSEAAQWYQRQKNLFYIFVKNLPFRMFCAFGPGAIVFAFRSFIGAARKGYSVQQLKVLVKCALTLPRMLRYRRHIVKLRHGSTSLMPPLWEPRG